MIKIAAATAKCLVIMWSLFTVNIPSRRPKSKRLRAARGREVCNLLKVIDLRHFPQYPTRWNMEAIRTRGSAEDDAGEAFETLNASLRGAPEFAAKSKARTVRQEAAPQ